MNPSSPYVHLLLENPWPLIVTLAVCLVLGRGLRRGPRRTVIVSLNLFLILALYLTAFFVETDQEAVARRTRQLVQSTISPVNLTIAQDCLSPDAQLMDMDSTQILDAIRRADGAYQIQKQTLQNLEVGRITPAAIRSRFKVLTTSRTLPVGAVPSQWQLDWRKGPDGQWRAETLQCLNLADAPLNRSMLP